MTTYLEDIFIHNISTSDINLIFELGSRDLKDAYKLQSHYNCIVYAFECNPDCIIECKKTMSERPSSNVRLVEKAICLDDNPVTFYPFDLTKYNNMGASSLLIKDFGTHQVNDPDYNRPNPQKAIQVDGIRIDTYCKEIR